MEIDLATTAARADVAVHHLLNALVAPRPIAWVSSTDGDGNDNLAPHSYFTIVSTEPPMVAFTSTGRKDTLANIERTGEFVVNVVSADLIGPMNESSAPLPPGSDEFVRAGLGKVASLDVRPPGVEGAPARLECVLEEVLQFGNGHLVVGRVLRVHVDDRLWRDGRVDVKALDPVARLSGSNYTTLGTQIRLPRPTS